MNLQEIADTVSEIFHAPIVVISKYTNSICIHANEVPAIVDLIKRYNTPLDRCDELMVAMISRISDERAVIFSTSEPIHPPSSMDNDLDDTLSNGRYYLAHNFKDTFRYFYSFESTRDSCFDTPEQITEYYNILLRRFEYALIQHTDPDSMFNRHIKQIDNINQQIIELEREKTRLNRMDNVLLHKHTVINED